jgi:photosystem II stability/assembly factor-like uncharacterized protein
MFFFTLFIDPCEPLGRVTAGFLPESTLEMTPTMTSQPPTTILSSPTPSPTPPASLFPGEVHQITFIDESHGWILGEDEERVVVGITKDAGRTWTMSEIPDAVYVKKWTYPPYLEDYPPRAVNRLKFISPQVGWAYGQSLFVTNDAGETWEDVSPEGIVPSMETSEGVYLALEKVWCTDPYSEPYEFSCQHRLHELSPGGGSVKSVEIPIDFLWGDLFIEGDNVWINAFEQPEDEDMMQLTLPILLGSSGPGKNWKEIRFDCPPAPYTGFTIAGEKYLLFACGDLKPGNKVVYVSSNGGMTWNLELEARLEKENDDHIFVGGAFGGGIRAATENIVWMNTGLYPMLSRDGGRSWTSLKIIPVEEGAPSVLFVDDLNGWAFRLWTVFYSDDAGESWREAIVGKERVSSIHTIVAVDPMHMWVLGWANGGYDALFHTQDGGLTWQCYSLRGLDACDLEETWEIVNN